MKRFKKARNSAPKIALTAILILLGLLTQDISPIPAAIITSKRSSTPKTVFLQETKLKPQGAHSLSISHNGALVAIMSDLQTTKPYTMKHGASLLSFDETDQAAYLSKKHILAIHDLNGLDLGLKWAYRLMEVASEPNNWDIRNKDGAGNSGNLMTQTWFSMTSINKENDILIALIRSYEFSSSKSVLQFLKYSQSTQSLVDLQGITSLDYSGISLSGGLLVKRGTNKFYCLTTGYSYTDRGEDQVLVSEIELSGTNQQTISARNLEGVGLKAEEFTSSLTLQHFGITQQQVVPDKQKGLCDLIYFQDYARIGILKLTLNTQSEARLEMVNSVSFRSSSRFEDIGALRALPGTTYSAVILIKNEGTSSSSLTVLSTIEIMRVARDPLNDQDGSYSIKKSLSIPSQEKLGKQLVLNADGKAITYGKVRQKTESLIEGSAYLGSLFKFRCEEEKYIKQVEGDKVVCSHLTEEIGKYCTSIRDPLSLSCLSCKDPAHQKLVEDAESTFPLRTFCKPECHSPEVYNKEKNDCVLEQSTPSTPTTSTNPTS